MLNANPNTGTNLTGGAQAAMNPIIANRYAARHLPPTHGRPVPPVFAPLGARILPQPNRNRYEDPLQSRRFYQGQQRPVPIHAPVHNPMPSMGFYQGQRGPVPMPVPMHYQLPSMGIYHSHVPIHAPMHAPMHHQMPPMGFYQGLQRPPQQMNGVPPSASTLAGLAGHGMMGNNRVQAWRMHVEPGVGPEENVINDQ